MRMSAGGACDNKGCGGDVSYFATLRILRQFGAWVHGFIKKNGGGEVRAECKVLNKRKAGRMGAPQSSDLLTVSVARFLNMSLYFYSRF